MSVHSKCDDVSVWVQVYGCWLGFALKEHMRDPLKDAHAPPDTCVYVCVCVCVRACRRCGKRGGAFGGACRGLLCARLLLQKLAAA